MTFVASEEESLNELFITGYIYESKEYLLYVLTRN